MPEFKVSKSISIHAPAEEVYAAVREFGRWPAWSPWLLAEPECAVAVAADGRSYTWEGAIVGSGEVAVKSESAPRELACRLTFLKPWKSESETAFSLRENAGVTELVWTMDGSLPFFLFWMKPMMTTFVGMDYERGLKMLKDYVETGSVPSQLEFQADRQAPRWSYLGVRTQGPFDQIDSLMKTDFEQLKARFSTEGWVPSGPPLAVYHKFKPVRNSVTYTVAFPVEETPAQLPESVVAGTLPETEAYAVVHTGAYRHLGNAWAAGMMRARAKVFRQNKRLDPFEVYENDPAEVPEAELRTRVYFPAK